MHTIGDRRLVVWGAGMLGRCLMRQLSAFAGPQQSTCFSDSNPILIGQTIDGNKVLEPNEAIELASHRQAFIVVALGMHNRNALLRLSDAGLAPDTDFTSHLKLSRPEAVIQISAHNGDDSETMPASTYVAVLHKLKSDISDLFHVELSGWGDPLAHPDLPYIISKTLPVVPCTVTTQLMDDEALVRRVLQAEPTQLVIIPPNGINRPEGANWERFVANLEIVAGYLREQACQTEIRFRFPRYRNNDAVATATQKLCEKHGIRWIEAVGYIASYDTTLDFCRSENLAAPLAKELSWPLRNALALAEDDRALPCLCQRIFPVIYPDTSVGICHLYLQPRLHPGYLSIDYDDLQDRRLNAAHCRSCQQYALHRLDIDVLQMRHGIQLIQLRPSEPPND